MTTNISIEVVYIGEARQYRKSIEVPAGTRVRAALEQSDILEAFPELDIGEVPLGIFGKKVGDDRVLKADDRLEVYRPLKIDPKQARRDRARQKR